MSSSESHFSTTALDRGERFQEALGHSVIGRVFTEIVAGSDSPAYRQLNWFSHEISTNIINSAATPGDPSAGWLPRNWRSASVVAVSADRLNTLKDNAIEDGLPFQEAVAYKSDDVWHVGCKPNRDELFEKLNKHEVAIAMRLGRRPLRASMGIWWPQSRFFSGISGIRVVEPSIQVSALSHHYPGTLLV